MFSHVFIGIDDFVRALRFYDALMQALGIAPLFVDRARPWAGWQVPGVPRPLFVIGVAHDGCARAAGNGQMVALLAASRRLVGHAQDVALAHGGTCEGAPGLRPEYHAHYYGAYVRDSEGNDLCVACHAPEG